MILRWSKTLVWYQSGRCGFEAASPGPPRGRPAPIGDITNGEMRLNDFGRLAKAAWEEIPLHFPDIELGTLVAMPNHNPRDYCYRAPHPKGDACVAPTDRARPT